MIISKQKIANSNNEAVAETYSTRNITFLKQKKQTSELKHVQQVT